MKNLNQRKINRILIVVLSALVIIMCYSRLTEQKRVDYYICYYQIASISSRDPNEIKEYCRNEVD